jgi:hypothetical protein
MSVHDAPDLSHRRHWYVKLIGAVPDQVPLLTVITDPSFGCPDIPGRAVLTGGLPVGGGGVVAVYVAV